MVSTLDGVEFLLSSPPECYVGECEWMYFLLVGFPRMHRMSEASTQCCHLARGGGADGEAEGGSVSVRRHRFKCQTCSDDCALGPFKTAWRPRCTQQSCYSWKRRKCSSPLAGATLCRRIERPRHRRRQQVLASAKRRHESTPER